MIDEAVRFRIPQIFDFRPYLNMENHPLNTNVSFLYVYLPIVRGESGRF